MSSSSQRISMDEDDEQFASSSSIASSFTSIFTIFFIIIDDAKFSLLLLLLLLLLFLLLLLHSYDDGEEDDAVGDGIMIAKGDEAPNAIWGGRPWLSAKRLRKISAFSCTDRARLFVLLLELMLLLLVDVNIVWSVLLWWCIMLLLVLLCSLSKTADSLFLFLFLGSFRLLLLAKLVAADTVVSSWCVGDDDGVPLIIMLSAIVIIPFVLT